MYNRVMENINPKIDLSKFYSDPDWKFVEDQLMLFIDEQLSDLPADSIAPSDYKAQVIARKRLKTALLKFLYEVKIINRPVEKITFR